MMICPIVADCICCFNSEGAVSNNLHENVLCPQDCQGTSSNSRFLKGPLNRPRVVDRQSAFPVESDRDGRPFAGAQSSVRCEAQEQFQFGRVSEATPEEIARIEQEAADLRASLGSLPPAEQLFAMERLKRLELRLCDIHQPRFVLNEQSLVREADLIVLDEVSMVGPEMAADLLAFGKPILVLGDPGQLPPIKGAGAFTDVAPDVMLTEIHRQAGESAIIRLATMARQGEPIPYGAHDGYVWKMRRTDLAPEQLLRGGQVICGRNATRLHLNAAMKHAAGFAGVHPVGGGEKIICLKNRNDLGLVNGMFVSLDNIVDEGSLYFSATVTDEEGNQIGASGPDGKRGRLRIYKGHFEDHIAFDKHRHDRDWKEKRLLTEATFGWAITGHKSQGSQWENVIVWDDGLGRSELDRRRWLYTVITRAERGLVILG